MTTEATARLTAPVEERDHIQGPQNAAVTLVEYGDYQCPHCRLVHPIISDLQERLGDRLRYVFRHFPITSSHPQAQLAAEAAEAASAQGMFWEMHDFLFHHQQRLNQEHLFRHAAEFEGLDFERFKQEITDGVHADRVQEDFLSGVHSGVNGTPTFFINEERYDGAWDFESLLEAIEKPMGVRIRLLSQQFAGLAASGGIVLLICTVLVLLWANSPLSELYFHLIETPLAFTLGDLSLSEHIVEWVNDGLMVIFFFVVGLEIKREVTVGELASPRRAALPIAAAIGGIVAPASIYLLFNAGTPEAGAWGVPMATDIAFTLGILALLGKRVPPSLKVFFTALAITDDLGSVLVLALFYTSHISWISLAFAAGFLAILVALNRARVYTPLPYALVGIGLWLAFLESGVHSSFSGVLLAMTIPTRSPANTRALLAQTITVLNDFNLPPQWRTQVDSRRQAVVQTLETITDRMQSPAQRLERDLHPWSTFLILPLFALTNAGVALSGESSMNLLSPLSLGIILGLVVGKPLGIGLASWLALRLGLAELPEGVVPRQFYSSSVLAGVGFTMSLFIAGAAFDDPAVLAEAKVAILVASVVAGVTGWVLLSLTSPEFDESTQASNVEIMMPAET